MKDENQPTIHSRPHRPNSLVLAALLVLTVAVFSLAVYQQAAIPAPINPGAQEYNTIHQYLPIHAGEMHFSRVPREYWEHRILMIKALGLSTIGVYVFWNHHELERGRFDFENGEKDLIGFLELAKKHGLKVILRPGPYVCAEWDFGGLPARLLGISDLKIRSSNKLYEDQVFLYFSALASVIKQYLASNGGHIILMQIENELGSLNKDYTHTYKIKAMWERLEIVCNFYYEDAYTNWMKHYWKGSNIGLSEGHHLNEYQDLIDSQYFKGRLVFGGQVYTGWLTHWGEEWQGLPTYDFRNNVQALLDKHYSFSLYVIHGGTNFALSAGSNQNKDGIFQPHITSYDYGAVINQQGRPHDKFKELAQMMAQYLNKILDPVPEPIPTIAISQIYLNLKAHLLDNLPMPTHIGDYSYFQSGSIRMYNQGIVIYETILPLKKKYDFKLLVHDIAYVYIDGELVKMLKRQARVNHTFSANCRQSQCVLRIIVEAMGHVNAGPYQQFQRKGLLYFEDRGEATKAYDWKVYRIHLNDTSIHSWTKTDQKVAGPILLRGIFKINQIGDTFFQTSQFDKGYLWVNDRLLGRFWKIGPQQKLFCPGVWLKKGINQVHVLELGDSTARLISSVAQ